MATSATMKSGDWRGFGFDANLSRQEESPARQAEYIGGSKFDVLLDDMLFNRMIKLKDLRKVPQGNDPGKIYWDGESKKYKLWVDATGQWADVVYTTTSTSTTTTSSSSTSTSTT